MKTPKIKNTSPSLGRIQKQRSKMVHCSTRLIPAHVDKDGNDVPAQWDFTKGNGDTYYKGAP